MRGDALSKHNITNQTSQTLSYFNILKPLPKTLTTDRARHLGRGGMTAPHAEIEAVAARSTPFSLDRSPKSMHAQVWCTHVWRPCALPLLHFDQGAQGFGVPIKKSAKLFAKP